MVPRITGLAILTVLSALAAAQQGKTVTIKFASEGPREVWIEKGLRPFDPKGKQSVTGKSIQLPLPEEIEGMIVCVYDIASGRVGFSQLADVIKKGEWLFDPSTSKTAYSVGFLLLHNHEPVASAVVKIKDENGRREAIITPQDKGVAKFLFVPFGDMTVDVDYKTEGKDTSLLGQTFEVTGKNSSTPIALSIEDPVETIKPEPTTQKSQPQVNSETQEAPPPKAPSNPAATALNMVLGAIVVGGIGYGIYRYVTQNQGKAAAVLGAAGVPMAGTNPGQAKPTGPPKQIILDDQAPIGTSDPTVLAGSVLAGPVIKNPRLVKTDGSIILISDGAQSIGRDATTDHPHPNESSMSRSHASIDKVGDNVKVVDSGSTNGTFINGRRITDPTPLSSGDTVQFGAVQYRYEE